MPSPSLHDQCTCTVHKLTDVNSNTSPKCCQIQVSHSLPSSTTPSSALNTSLASSFCSHLNFKSSSTDLRKCTLYSLIASQLAGNHTEPDTRDPLQWFIMCENAYSSTPSCRKCALALAITLSTIHVYNGRMSWIFLSIKPEYFNM